MNKEQMDALWNGPIINHHKINRFQADKTNMYTCTMKVYKKTLVDEFTETGYYKNEKLARGSLEMKLNALRHQKYPWGHPDSANISWQVFLKNG